MAILQAGSCRIVSLNFPSVLLIAFRPIHPFNQSPPHCSYILSTLGAQAGVTLRNAMMVDVALAERRKSRALLDIVHTLNQGGGGGHGDGGDASSAVSVSSQIFTVIARTTDLVDSDRTTFFLVDRRAGELWSMQGSINLRFPITKGLAGAVARTGEVINIPDAYKDARFNQETDRRTGYHTQTVLVMPMFGSAAAGAAGAGASEGAIAEGANEDGEDAHQLGSARKSGGGAHRLPVIGVLQVINKKDGTAFDEADEEVLKMFLAITGPILEKSTMYQQLARPAQSKEAALAFGGGGGSGLTPRRSITQKQNISIVGFAEEDDAEEES